MIVMPKDAILMCGTLKQKYYLWHSTSPVTQTLFRLTLFVYQNYNLETTQLRYKRSCTVENWQVHNIHIYTTMVMIPLEQDLVIVTSTTYIASMHAYAVS